MDHENTPPADSNDPTFQRARALSLSVGAIRKAQGKKCPGDFPVGTLNGMLWSRNLRMTC